jgi:plastocyanin
VFGRIYEYFLNQLAQSGAQEGGEFFTPPSLVRLIVNVIEPDHGAVLDPACGSAGMFVQTGHFIEDVSKKTTSDVNIRFYGQEKADLNSKLARMDLAVHGLEGNIRIGNTFYDDHHGLLGQCDFVMANPPFNVDGVAVTKVKKQVGDNETGRLRFGLPGIATKSKGKKGDDSGETVAALAVFLASPALGAQLTAQVYTSDGRPAPDVVVTVQPTTPWARQAPPQPAVVTQKSLRFEPFITAVPVGATIRFSNEDCYDHHVRSLPGVPLGNVAPAKNFGFRIEGAKAGRVSSAEVMLDAPGVIVLGCHIHGSMRGHVFVSPMPWVAVTDANGQVVIDGLPDGAPDLKVWHPEQVVEQAGQHVMLGAAPLKTEARLNFRPPVRRGQVAPAHPYPNY